MQENEQPQNLETTSGLSIGESSTGKWPSGSGCLQGGLLAALDIWILIAVLIAAVFTWITEQTLAVSRQAGDPRWFVTFLLGLAVLVPSSLAWLRSRDSTSGRFYGAYALSGLFVILMAPARLAGLTQAYGATGLLIMGMLIFLALMAWRRSRGEGVPTRAGFSGLGYVLLIAGLMGLPWLLWGAFGSLADLLLNLAVALLFGWSTARLLPDIYAPGGDFDPQARPGSVIFVEGKVTAFVLLVMAIGLGVNGSQGLLVFMLPPLGWVLAVLYHRYTAVDLTLISDLEDDIEASGPPPFRPLDNRAALALLVGISAFWPLALLDPDELAAAPGFGLIELMQWTAQAVFFSAIAALAAAAILSLFRGHVQFTRSGIYVMLAALAVWLTAGAVYFLAGQPGLHGDRLYVILKQQVDLSPLAEVEDYTQRRTAVYTILVEQADQSQAGLRSSLDRWGIPYRPFYLENAVEVQGGPLVRWWLLRRPEVDRVLESPVLRPLPAPPAKSTGFAAAPDEPPWNLTMIGADRVWRELGVTGAGILIGQSDSGVQGDHPELADSYRGRITGPDYSWYDPWNHSREAVDSGGHGTHTLGTVLGNRVGVAPDAQWIGCVNLARNLGSPSYYLDCMQFSLAPFPLGGDPLRDGVPELGAHILNNSWGCPPLEGCDSSALLPAVAALRAAGVFVAVSAGNDGSEICGTVADPISLYDQVYSVGAVDSSRALAAFSSVGPVTVDGSQRTKPDIAAPGVRVLSAYPGSTYNATSGTSMAGPHVAGVVALMWSANPSLIGDIDRTEQILNETAAPYTGPLPNCVDPGTPNNAVGYGILDAYAAVSRALGR